MLACCAPILIGWAYLEIKPTTAWSQSTLWLFRLRGVFSTKRFLVDEIVTGSSAVPIMALALLKTPWRRPHHPTYTLQGLYWCLMLKLLSSPLKLHHPALSCRCCIDACCSINYPWPVPKSPSPIPYQSGIHSALLGYSLVLELHRN